MNSLIRCAAIKWFENGFIGVFALASHLDTELLVSMFALNQRTDHRCIVYLTWNSCLCIVVQMAEEAANSQLPCGKRYYREHCAFNMKINSSVENYSKFIDLKMEFSVCFVTNWQLSTIYLYTFAVIYLIIKIKMVLYWLFPVLFLWSIFRN